MATQQFTAYRLHFTAPLHIGDQRMDYGTSLLSVASDTLYAALTATLAKLGETVPAGGDLGCVLSSLFPYCTAEDKIAYYFPKPLGTRIDTEKADDLKKIKKLQWLTQAQLEQVLQGKPLTEYTKTPEFVQSSVSARVQVSRSCEDAKPFYMERLYFADGAGLYFLACGNTELLEKALPLLAQEGIGTDRNVGNGAFEYTKEQIELSVPEQSEYALSLSTYVPENREQLQHAIGGQAAYELVRRGGWITTAPYNTYRKNAIYALAAGSVLAGLHTGDGAIVDLAPQGIVSHPIWRCGKTICIPIQLKQDESN